MKSQRDDQVLATMHKPALQLGTLAITGDKGPELPAQASFISSRPKKNPASSGDAWLLRFAGIATYVLDRREEAAPHTTRPQVDLHMIHPLSSVVSSGVMSHVSEAASTKEPILSEAFTLQVTLLNAVPEDPSTPSRDRGVEVSHLLAA